MIHSPIENDLDARRESPNELDGGLVRMPPTEQREETSIQKSLIEKQQENMKDGKIRLKKDSHFTIVEYSEFFGYLLHKSSSLAEQLFRESSKEPDGPVSVNPAPDSVKSTVFGDVDCPKELVSDLCGKPGKAASNDDVLIEECLQLMKDRYMLPKKADSLPVAVFKEAMVHLLARISRLAENLEESRAHKRFFSESVSSPNSVSSPKSVKTTEDGGSNSQNQSLSDTSNQSLSDTSNQSLSDNVPNNEHNSSEDGSVGSKMACEPLENDPFASNNHVYKFRDNGHEENMG